MPNVEVCIETTGVCPLTGTDTFKTNNKHFHGNKFEVTPFLMEYFAKIGEV